MQSKDVDNTNIKEISVIINIRNFKNKSVVRASFLIEVKNDNDEIIYKVKR